MKISLFFAILTAAAYVYLNNPCSAPVAKTVAVPPVHYTVSTQPIVVATFSSYNRWKTGPNAQTDLKTGPNAQTEFEPFAPNVQANWNQSAGFASVSGGRIRLK